MNDDQDVIEFVASGRVELPGAAASRIRANLVRAELEGASTSSPPRASWSVTTLAAAGVAVAVGVAWLQRRETTSPQLPAAGAGPVPGHSERAPASAQDPSPPPAPAADPRAGGPQVPLLSASVACERAPLVLACDVVVAGAADGFEATVAVVVRGGAEWRGRQVWLQRGAEPEAAIGSCLDQVVPGAAGTGSGRYLFALAPLPGTAAGERPRLVPAFLAELRGVPVLDHVPFVRDWEPGAPAVPLLRRWLVGTATKGDAAALRYHALSALAAFDGGGEPGPESPWLDSATISLLVPLAYDASDAVRERMARCLPQADSHRTYLGGVQGEAHAADVDQALRALRFDRCPAVREQLRRRCWPADWWKEEQPDNRWWSTLSSPAEFGAFRRMIEAKSRELGITDEIAMWRRQIEKGQDLNVVAAALGLPGALDREAARKMLRGLASGSHNLGRAIAAGGLIAHGERDGYDSLRALVAGTDVAAAACALDVVRNYATPEALDVIRAAANHVHPAIRARAGAALRELRVLARHEVDVAIAAFGKDPHELVRIAAGTEPFVVAPPWPANR